MINQTSRYSQVETKKIIGDRGTEIIILRRRFLPQMKRISMQSKRTIQMEDRLDNISYEELGNPKQFWVIADSNHEFNPHKLTQRIGRIVYIGQEEIGW